MNSELKNIISSVDRANAHRRHLRIVGAAKKHQIDNQHKPNTIWHMKHIPYKAQDRGGKNENEEDVLQGSRDHR